MPWELEFGSWKLSLSSTHCQSLSEHVWQSRGDDLRLRSRDVVFNPLERQRARVGVEKAVRCSRIAIARLADRAAVDEKALALAGRQVDARRPDAERRAFPVAQL